jgi:hypothetical protein
MRLPPTTVAGLLAAALALGACGTDGDDAQAGDGPTATAPTTTADAPASTAPASSAPDGDPGGAERVEPRPGMADVRPVSFDPTEAEATGSAVLVRFWGGVDPCFVLDRYDVVETDEVVAIGLFAGSDPARPGAVCIELAQRYEVEVPLGAPLGDRDLVDASQQ